MINLKKNNWILHNINPMFSYLFSSVFRFNDFLREKENVRSKVILTEKKINKKAVIQSVFYKEVFDGFFLVNENESSIIFLKNFQFKL